MKTGFDEGREEPDRGEFQAAFRRLNCPMVLVDTARDRILDANDLACRMLEYSYDALLRVPISRIHPEEMEDLSNFAREVAKDQGGWSRSFSCRTATGKSIPVEIYAAPLKVDSIPCLIALLRDLRGQKISESTLRESELRYRNLFVRAPVMLHSVDESGRLIEVSDRWLERLGYRRSEVIGRKSVEFLTPDSRKYAETVSLPRFRRTGRAMDVPYQFLAKSGEPVDVLLSAVSEKDSTGKTVRSMAVLVEITEQRKAERSLRLTQFTVDCARDAILWVGADARISYANETMCHSLGFSRDELLRMRLFDITTHVSPADWPGRWRKLREKGSIVFEADHRTKAGRIVPFEISASFVDFGGVEMCCAFARDIGERRRIDALQARLAAFPMNNPHPVLEFDGSATPIYENAAAKNLRVSLGLRTIADLIPPETASTVLECLSTGASRLGMGCIVEGRSLTWSFVPILAARSVIAYGQDITERLELEAKLRQAEKMEAIGRLAGGIAHDFNNVLCAMRGFNELARAEIRPDDPVQEYLAEIERAGKRASDLTHQLLAFSRKRMLVKETLDLVEVIRNMTKLLRQLIGETIAIEINSQTSEAHVQADRGQIEQIILNMAVNARDAMPKGGTLSIDVASVAADSVGTVPGDYVVLSVVDSGVGMDPRTFSHLFEPFFTTKDQGKGTGMGLATVYGIVKQYGGHIEAESEVGKGTTFRIYLPRAAAPEGAKNETTRRRIRGGNETILVVEDDVSVGRMISHILKAQGYSVLHASNGEEALRIAREHPGPIQVVLSDVVMPGMGGPEMVQQMKQIRPEANALFMSGYIPGTSALNGPEAETDRFLQKPFTAEALLAKLRTMLAADP